MPKAGLRFGCGSVVSLAIVVSGCTQEEVSPDLGRSEQSSLDTGEVAGWAYWDGTAIDTTRSWNSGGGAIAADHPSTGNYTVYFGVIAGTGGNVQVTAAGSNNRRCKVTSWANISGLETIAIKCFEPGGSVSADTPFVVSYANFVGGTAVSTEGAYVVMDQPTGGPLDTTYMWGDSITVTRESIGVYRLNFANQILAGGNVQVTAAWSGDSTYCKVNSWGSDRARVRCFGGAGAPADTKFSFRYHKNVSIHDSPLGAGGFVWQDTGYGVGGCSAFCCFSACRTPPTTWNWVLRSGDCDDSDATVCKAIGACEIGVYTVHFPSLWDDHGQRGIPGVTAYGTNSDYCKVVSWTIPSSVGDATVVVNCFDAAGNYTESRFNAFFWSGVLDPC